MRNADKFFVYCNDFVLKRIVWVYQLTSQTIRLAEIAAYQFNSLALTPIHHSLRSHSISISDTHTLHILLALKEIRLLRCFCFARCFFFAWSLSFSLSACLFHSFFLLEKYLSLLLGVLFVICIEIPKYILNTMAKLKFNIFIIKPNHAFAH